MNENFKVSSKFELELKMLIATGFNYLCNTTIRAIAHCYIVFLYYGKVPESLLNHLLIGFMYGAPRVVHVVFGFELEYSKKNIRHFYAASFKYLFNTTYHHVTSTW